MYVLINIYFSVIKSDKKQVKFFSEHVNCVTYTYRQEKNQNNFFLTCFWEYVMSSLYIIWAQNLSIQVSSTLLEKWLRCHISK